MGVGLHRAAEASLKAPVLVLPCVSMQCSDVVESGEVVWKQSCQASTAPPGLDPKAAIRVALQFSMAPSSISTSFCLPKIG